MAEFQEVAKELERMCNTYHAVSGKCGTDECPLYLKDLCYAQAMAHVHGNDACNLEEVVMSWAAEHPKPVYPTWREYLQEQGILDVEYIPAASSTTSTSKSYVQTVKTLTPFYHPIPDDIAQKLGIEPKEG